MEILQSKILGLKLVFSSTLVLNWVSSSLSFFLSAYLHCCNIYIFTAPTCTTTIITLEPCALNAEFQHFVPRFSKTSGCPWPSDTVKLRASCIMWSPLCENWDPTSWKSAPSQTDVVNLYIRFPYFADTTKRGDRG